MAYKNEALFVVRQQLRLKDGVGARTLTGAVTCDATTETFCFWDPGGASRDITMLAEADAKGLFHVFVNEADADGENLVIKDDGASTIVTLNRYEWAIVACDGTTWYDVPLSAFADLLATANAWALLQTLTTGALIPDSGVLKFGTPGTDLLLTADGTDVVVTATGDLVFADSVDLKIGTGKDLGFVHDGTISTISNAVGDLVIDNTDVNDQIIVRVGTDTTATGIEFRNDSDVAMWAVEPTSASAGRLRCPDNSTLVIGTGGDLSVTHDGTDTIVDSVNATAKLALRTGTDTSATQVDIRNDSNSPLFIVTGAGLITFADGTTFQRLGAGTSTGDVIERIGPSTTEGMEIRVYEATLSPAAIETSLFTVPANSVIDSVQANVQTALTGGGTTVTFGFGITGDVDLYGTAFSGGVQADLLTQNAKVNAIGTKTNAGAGIGVYNAATVALKLIGAATGGTSAGDTALTAGTVRVRVVYRVLLDLANA